MLNVTLDSTYKDGPVIYESAINLDSLEWFVH